MGSFNVKCSLTGMDILAGDPTVVLLGRIPDPKSLPYLGGARSQGAVFQLRATPIFGIYDDYGWIEDVDQDSLDMAIYTLQGFFPDEFDSTVTLRDLRGAFLRHNWDKPDGRGVAFVHRGAWNALVGSLKDHPMDTTIFFRESDIENYPEIPRAYYHQDITIENLFTQAFGFLDRHPLQAPTPVEGYDAEEQATLDKLLQDGLEEEQARKAVNLMKEFRNLKARFESDHLTPSLAYTQVLVTAMLPFSQVFRGDLQEAHRILSWLLAGIVRLPRVFIEMETVFSGINLARKYIRPHQDMPCAAQWIEDEMRITDTTLANWTLHYYTEMRPPYNEE